MYMQFTPHSGQYVRLPRLLKRCENIAVGFMDVFRILVPNHHFLNNIGRAYGPT